RLGALGAGGLVLGLASPVGRRGRFAILCVLLLAACAFSGCAGTRGATVAGQTSAVPTGGTLDAEQVPDSENSLAEKGNGSIVGRVSDDQGLPLGGVHVSLLGMPLFTDSSGSGAFSIRNVPPGTYTVRFDLAE